MAMSQRARNLFQLPDVRQTTVHNLANSSARFDLERAKFYIGLGDYARAHECVLAGQQKVFGISKYLAVKDELEDLARQIQPKLGMGGGLCATINRKRPTVT